MTLASESDDIKSTVAKGETDVHASSANACNQVDWFNSGLATVATFDNPFSTPSAYLTFMQTSRNSLCEFSYRQDRKN